MQVLLLLKKSQHGRFLNGLYDNLDCSIIPSDKNVSCIQSGGHQANRALPNGSLQADERSVFFSVDFAERRSVDLAECKSSLGLAPPAKPLAQAHRVRFANPSEGPEAQSLAIGPPPRRGLANRLTSVARLLAPSFNKASCEIYQQTV